MAKRVIWSKRAKTDHLEILKYWEQRIGNKNYSKKLEIKFRETMRHISDNNYWCKATDIENIRVTV